MSARVPTSGAASRVGSGSSPRVALFGATSRIASEVALVYAERGARLHLVGRDPGKLEALVSRASHAAVTGAAVTHEACDFSALDALEGVAERALTALGGLDVALVAHGDLGDQLASERSFAAAEQTFVVNFLSAVALLIPLANHVEAARSGTLGVITSVAGERGRPRNYTYGAAKGALNVYLQGLRSRLYPAHVAVTTLKLGPVDTPMTRDHEKNPLFARPEPVAAAIVRALDAGVAEAYVPSYWAPIMAVVRRVPEPLFQRLRALSGR